MNPDYLLMLICWAIVAVWVAVVIAMNRKIHPKALFALFMVELWERFSYYGMRALLILYMTANIMDGGFAFDDAKAYGIYGAYGALVYLTPLIGGYFADKLVGFRKAIVWGAILMALGQFTLFISGSGGNNEIIFYLGLAVLVVGNGFFKPNISSMIGRFYEEGDNRRDGAFTLFYMGINMGAFLAPLTCGAIGENEGWQYGFLTAGVGMVIGYLIFLWAQKQGMYGDVGKGPDVALDKPVIKGIPNKLLPFVASVIMIILASTLIVYNDVVDIMLSILSIMVIGYLLYEAGKMETVAKQRIWVVVVLLFFTTTFWTFFELAGSALSLFTERNVDRSLFGIEIKTTLFQSFNPLFIMLFAPIFSWIWIKLANAKKEPAAPYKFGMGLILLGFGFLALNLGGASASAGMIPAMFMVLLYLLHTIGELTLSPVGLSLVTKLSPRHMVGFLMGIWLLSSSLAHQAGKHVAKLTTVSEKTIVQSDAFKNAKMDKDIKALLLTKEFVDKLEDGTVEGVLTDSTFIAKLNAKGNKEYGKSTVYIKEALDEANKYTGAAKKKKLKAAKVEFISLKENVILSDTVSAKNLSKITKNTPGTAVMNSIRSESLNKGLGVFEMLGFIAMACGLLLFVIGKPIKRWMHGIN